MSENKGPELTPTISRVAIIGGGPGGLMTAYQLQQRCSIPFETTIYEAGPRLGGKILSRHFSSAPVPYEAGAAELYDYSHIGEDPLRDLIERLGLTVKPMSGASVVIHDQVLHDLDDVGRVYGKAARQSLAEFDARAREWMGPQAYYDADWRESSADAMASRTFDDELSLVTDPAARHFIQTLVHSDLATEPHRTSAAYGLQNYLMNDPSYMRLYTIDGGIERLPQELASRVEARILSREPVVRVERTPNDRIKVSSRRNGKIASEEYDLVVVALPNSYIPAIEWAGEPLAEAMHRHYVHYDHPAHYLRVSVLFRQPFWEQHLHESYWMLDAFGGCCLYDESARSGSRPFGALGWLLAGDAALTAGNFSDEELIEKVLDSLPSFLQHGRELFIEGRVHRWLGSVSGLPGGSPALDMESRHIPDPARHDLFVVGDYLFDSTINGVLDSADYVAECLTEAIEANLNSQVPATAYSAAL